jgi:hypothetical protein
MFSYLLTVLKAYRAPMASNAAKTNPGTSPGVPVEERETAQGSTRMVPKVHKNPTSRSVCDAVGSNLASVALKRGRGSWVRVTGDVRRPKITRTLRSHRGTPAQRKPRNRSLSGIAISSAWVPPSPITKEAQSSKVSR